MKKFLAVALCISLCSCVILPTDRSPKVPRKSRLAKLTNDYPGDFKTGLVIVIERPGPLLRNPMEVVIRDQKSGTVFRKQAQWNTRTGISLPASEYAIKTFVPYLGKDIWEIQKEAVIDSGVIAELRFSFPTLVTSQASAHLSPNKANKESRVQADSTLGK
jgi:hypothetical protein